MKINKERNRIEKIKRDKINSKENRLILLLFQNRIHHWFPKDYCY